MLKLHRETIRTMAVRTGGSMQIATWYTVGINCPNPIQVPPPVHSIDNWCTPIHVPAPTPVIERDEELHRKLDEILALLKKRQRRRS